MILAMVVLGGMGSILGVIIASLALKLLPEYLRAFAEYRMLVFGAVMVLMMILPSAGPDQQHAPQIRSRVLRGGRPMAGK